MIFRSNAIFCNSSASGVVLAPLSKSLPIRTPRVPTNPDSISFISQICLTKLAEVVLPFVPVIPIAVKLLNGYSYNQDAISPTSSLGFG